VSEGRDLTINFLRGGGRGEGGWGRVMGSMKGITSRRQEISGWDKSCWSVPGIYMFFGGSLMSVLSEGRQQGISPVIKRGENWYAYSWRNFFFNAVAGLLQMGYTTHLAVDRVYKMYWKRLLVTMIIDAIIVDKQVGIYRL
jgi:hypothetical protein